jgi:hypothetical protein
LGNLIVLHTLMHSPSTSKISMVVIWMYSCMLAFTRNPASRYWLAMNAFCPHKKVVICTVPSTGDRCCDFRNIFAEKFGKKLAFLTQNKDELCKILIITFVFEKNAKFFVENCQKSQKIVIITSTLGWPDWANFRLFNDCFLLGSTWKL